MIFWKSKLKSCGKNVTKEKNVAIKYPERISVGNNVELRMGCQLYAQGNTTDKNKFNDIEIVIADDVHIKENVNLSTYGGYIKIGQKSNVGQNTVIYGQGGIDIGRDVLIGPNCAIISGQHKFEDKTISINKQGSCDKGIVIQDDVWIGTNVIILDGVTIGKGCVIGAGAVVTKSLPDYSVAYGVPATVKRKRGE